MIDHITLHVRDVAQSHTFYAAALKPLGYIDKVRHGDTIGMGVNDGTPRADFYLSPTDDSDEDQSTTPITHIAFRAQSQQEVKDFTQPLSQLEAPIMGNPDLATTTPVTLQPSFWIQTATISKL